MKKTILLIVLQTAISVNSMSQTLNFEKGLLIWELPSSQRDSRLEIKGFAGSCSFGEQQASLYVKNISNSKLFFRIKIIVTNNCAVITSSTTTNSLKAGDICGSSLWFDGFDVAKNCSIKTNLGKTKNGSDFISKINRVEIEIIEIRDLNEAKAKNDEGKEKKECSSGSTLNNNGGTKTENGVTNTSYSGNCPPQVLTMVGQAGDNCVSLRWISHAVIAFNDKTNEIKTENIPLNFILQYKRIEDIYWKDKKEYDYHLSYCLSGLDACTKYEVRIQRDCGNGNKSEFSKSIVFTTACVAPTKIRIINTTSTSVSIGGIYTAAINCNFKSQTPVSEVEYKTAGASWQVVICNFGQDCILHNLTPDTDYRIRKRYKYDNNKYSQYSQEIIVKTKP